MKVLQLFVLLLLSNSQLLLSQSGIKVLLERVEKNHGVEKARLLNQISDSVSIYSPRESLDYASKALVEAKKVGDLEQQAQAYLNIGIALRYLGHNKDALDSLYRTISFINDLNNRKLIAQILNAIGVVHYQLGHDSLSLESYNKSLSIRNELNDFEGIADILNNMGNLYNGLGNFDKALEFYFKCLKYDDILNNDKGKSATYSNIGMVYQNLGDYTKSLDYYRKAYLLSEQRKDFRKMASILNNIGAVYLAMQNYDSSIWYTNQSNKYYTKLGETLQMQRNFTNLGLVYEYKLRYDSSLYYHRKALEMSEGLANPSLIVGSHINLSRIFLKQNKLQLALNELKAGEKEMENTDNLYVISRLMLGFANVYAETGEYRNAFNYLASHLSFRDSIYNLEKAEKIAQVEVQYETEKKTQRIDLLKRDQKINELKLERSSITIKYLILLSITFLVLSSIIIILYIQKQRVAKLLEKQNTTINEQNEMLKQANEELNTVNTMLSESQQSLYEANKTKDLLFGIIAHDIKSPLERLNILIHHISQESNSFTNKELKGYIDELDLSSQSVSHLIRNLITWAQYQQQRINYKEELVSVKELVTTNLILFDYQIKQKHINIALDIEDFAVNTDRVMLDFIIRNLISNAIKYSYEFGKICVTTKYSNVFSIAVSDNGIGMDNETIEGIKSGTAVRKKGTMNEVGSGLALLICKNFAEMMNAEFIINSEKGNGSTFILNIAGK